MNGIDFLADTNAILYVMKKNPCMKPFLKFSFGISIITEMELATAIEFGAPLITADKGFCKISELNLRLIEPEF